MRPWITAVCASLAWATAALAYVPAYASDSTDPREIVPSNGSLLYITGAPDSAYGKPDGNAATPILLAYLAAGPHTTGFSQGALLEFNQQNLSSLDTNVNASWVALVACDTNATSPDAGGLDVFTDARQRGATAVILYTQADGNSDCILEPAFRAAGQAPLDIYSVYNLAEYSLIANIIATASFHIYDAITLAAEAGLINQAIHDEWPVSAKFFLASANACNATAGPNGSSDASNNTVSPPSKSSTPTTAMVVLYVITGVVSALFVLIIASGAIRAIRNPERYGPRGGAGPEDGAAPQSRTQGLSRAILDTFAVVRFRAPGPPVDAEAGEAKPRASSMDKGPWELVELPELRKREDVAVSQEPGTAGPSSPCKPAPLPPAVVARPSASAVPADEPVLPDAIGRETCPICIVDFEDDDALRVLPCVGQHRFHQACVDPWLLELSSSCPLCRQDFAALESLIAGDADLPLTPTSPQHPRASQGRFTRYIRLARRRTLERHGAGTAPAALQVETRTREADVRRYADDPTDPYMPVVPTAL